MFVCAIYIQIIFHFIQVGKTSKRDSHSLALSMSLRFFIFRTGARLHMIRMFVFYGSFVGFSHFYNAPTHIEYAAGDSAWQTVVHTM